MDLKIDYKAIRGLLKTDEVAGHVAKVADDVAADAAAATGPKAGQPTPIVTDRDDIAGPAAMVRRDMIGATRARSTIAATHPAPAGRKKAREALQAAAAKGGRG